MITGERKRAKRGPLRNGTLRRLAPSVSYSRIAATDRKSQTETFRGTQVASSKQNSTPGSSNSNSRRSHSAYEEQELSLCTATDPALFTVSSPQTLFPDHESLVPKIRTPSSELLYFARNQLRPALWPHGFTATLAACLFSARALGIDIDRVMDPQYLSPFYKPSSSRTLPPESSIQPTYLGVASDPRVTLPSSLRPCFAQIVFPHHACLDLLPLPRLRETAVMLNVRAQHELGGATLSVSDGVQELKKDVYLREGVRFRGTGELSAAEYITYDGIQHRGHPWESASWAVAPWFARKWKYLLDT